jgi:predicted DNA-binding transcriptional regulator AlpA
MRFMSKKQVRDVTTYSFTQMQRLEKEGKFPERLRLGAGRYARVVYVESEIIEWMKSKLAKRLTTQTAP